MEMFKNNGVLAVHMAEELRQVNWISTATSDTNAFSSLVNQASEDMYIRGIHFASGSENSSTTAAVRYRLQVTKDNQVNDTDDSTEVSYTVIGSGEGEQGPQVNRSFLFAKGQLVLEPGEALYGHYDLLAGTPGGGTHHIAIDYHY